MVLEHLPHLMFFIIVCAATVRLVDLNVALCWQIVTISSALAAVYTAVMTLRSRLSPLARHGWVMALVLLWAALLALTPPFLTVAYVWCAVPLACAVLRVLGRRGALVAVGAITTVLVARLVWATGRFDAEVVLIPVVAVWGTVALYRAQQRDAEERQRLVEELRGTRDVLVREQHRAGVLEERTRIARDLHDTLAQELSGGVMLLQAAERNWEGQPDVARTQVRVVADGLSAGLAEARRIITDLTPPEITDAGLACALRLLCDRARQNETAERVEFRAVGPSRPRRQVATTLFRVAQSALANVREHAHATTVTVILRQQQERVELEVRDDGAGFELAGEVSRTGRGFGLHSAKTRLLECGGHLDVDSAPGRGTRIVAAVPLLTAAVS